MPTKKAIQPASHKLGRPFEDDTIQEWVDKTKEVLNVVDFCSDIEVKHPGFYQGRIKTADKFLSVAAYMVYGSSRLASKYLGGRVKAGTIRKWKYEASWWPEVEQAVRKAMGHALDYQLTKTIHDAVREADERLQNGDEVLDKNGNRVRKKVTARDAAVVATQMNTIRALGRGDPTSRKESTSNDDRLKQIEERLRNFGMESKLIQGESEVLNER